MGPDVCQIYLFSNPQLCCEWRTVAPKPILKRPHGVTGESEFTKYVKKGNELHERYEKGEISLENEPDDSDDFFKRLEEQN